MVNLGNLNPILQKGLGLLAEYGEIDQESLIANGSENEVYYVEVVMKTHKSVPRPFIVDDLLFVVHEILPSKSDNLPVPI